MKEQLEKELNNWWKEYKEAEEQLLKEHPLRDGNLSNKHLINKLAKDYMQKKQEIINKYSTQK